MDPLVIGLDLGTTHCKASAFQLDGTAIASVQTEITTYRPHSGWAEQDPVEWRSSVIEVLARLVLELDEKAQRVQAIGVSSHGPGVIPTDESFRPLWRCPTWQDQRAFDLVEDLIQHAGDSWIGLGLGTPDSSFGVQLYWTTLHRPDLLSAAAHLLDVKGFLLALLTGKVVDEPSSSPNGGEITQSLFDFLHIDTNLLAETVPSTSIVGNLTPEIREWVHLPPSVVVVAGLNDGAAATLGAGIVELGQGIVSLSTNGVMRTTIPHRLPVKTILKNMLFCYSYVNDLYVTGGMTKCGGDSVKWLMDNFYQSIGGEERIFDLIAAEAAQSPKGANGILFMPYLVGMGTPVPTRIAQGAFMNLARHHQRADFARALLEGVAFALKDIGETFDELGLAWERLSFTGGGSKNPTWRQIVADILGKPLLGVRADSVLGVALLAATSIGLFDNIKEAVQSMVKRTFFVEPIQENVDYYRHVYDQFRRIKKMLKELSTSSD